MQAVAISFCNMKNYAQICECVVSFSLVLGREGRRRRNIRSKAPADLGWRDERGMGRWHKTTSATAN
eukprot:12907828-Prorocentrum_lima.AAC.1